MISKIDQESHLMDIKHYLAANFSCTQTIAANGPCTGDFEDSIDAYRANGDTLTDEDGSDFFKFTIRVSCDGDDYRFFYKNLEADNLDLAHPNTHYKDVFNEVPISCVDTENLTSTAFSTLTGPPNSNLQVNIHDRWVGVCCKTAGASPVITNNACNWIRGGLGRALEDTTSGLGLDCPENGQTPAPCTCIAPPTEEYHGVGYPAPNTGKHISSSIDLTDGGPIFPNNGRETCLHVHNDGSMTAIYSELGALTGSSHPNHGSWDFDKEEWVGIAEPALCHHFRLIP